MNKQDIPIDERIASTQKSKERKYWLNKFSGQLNKAYFPHDHLDPQEQHEQQYQHQQDDNPGENHQYKGRRVTLSLSPGLCANFLKASRDSDARLFMVLAASVVLLLRKYTHNADITIGTTVLKQTGEVNYFNTVLPLRNHIHGGMTFKELLLQVRETVIGATQHQNYPVKSLLYQLKLPYSDIDFPLFDTAVLLQNIHSQTYLQGIKPNVIFSFTRRDQQIEAAVEYNAVYYTPQTIDKIMNHFNHLAHQALTGAAEKIDSYKFLTPAEERQLLARYNDYPLQYPQDKTIHQLFQEQVERTPDAIAAAQEDSQIQFKHLNEKADRLAGHLISKGITRGSIVGLMVERSIEMAVGILGILKAGAAYLPMDDEYPENRNIYIAGDSKMKALLTRQFLPGRMRRFLDVLAAENVVTLTVEDGTRHPAGSTGPRTQVPPLEKAYVIYTSGTTGTPKGVIIEHRSVVNLIYGLNQRVYNRYPPARNVCLVAPYVFDASVKQIFAALLLGHKLCIAPAIARIDSNRLLRLYHRHSIDISDGTPMLIRFLYEILKDQKELPRVRHFLIGGEALPRETVTSFFNLFPQECPKITNVYGPTECCVDAASFQITPQNAGTRPIIPIGKPMPNYRVYIISPQNEPVPEGVPGELCIGGAGVGRGYLNRVTLTSRKFISAPIDGAGRIYRSGDLARWLPGGDIEFLGRLDRQVKIRGVRIELEEIETALGKHKHVKNPMVIPWADEIGEQYLCAYYLSGEEINPVELKEFLSQGLPHYLIPMFLIRVETFPVTPNGKVDLAALPRPVDKAGAQDEYEPPSNATETALVEIWEDVLAVQKVGVKDDFFALGGHSLRSTIMQARIESQFKIKIPLTEIFNAPTIRQLARYVERSGRADPVPRDKNLVLLKKSGAAPAKHLFFIHDGTGETDRYTGLCDFLDSEAYFWGIRADRLEDYAPRKITIQDVARQYIRTIKKVQPRGPYHISGYCIGGTIAFEMVRQLEQSGEDIAFFSIIDSPLAEKDPSGEVAEFTLESELKWVRDFLPDEATRERFQKLTRMDRIWASIAEYIDETRYRSEDIIPLIPRAVTEALPNFRQLSAKQLIYYFNVLRTFVNAREYYLPHGKVKAPIHYFGAARSNSGYEDSWRQYFSRINSYRVEGSHYSIFTMPELVEFSRKFGEVLP